MHPNYSIHQKLCNLHVWIMSHRSPKLVTCLVQLTKPFNVAPCFLDSSACATRGGVARQIDSSAISHHGKTTTDHAKGQTSHQICQVSSFNDVPNSGC